ncbi:MAG: FtsX-like permease family protein [Gammaproteobacteria bacterium]
MFWVWWHVSAGHARAHRLRTVVQILAIATGVALGYAVSLINTAALTEFNAALREVNGEADAAIEGPRTGFDESLFARVAAHPGVALASPVLATDVLVIGKDARLPILGIDALRAGWVTPGLLPDFSSGVRAGGARAGDAAPTSRFALFADGIFLSPAALERFGVQPGDSIQVQAGDQRVTLTVRGSLPGTRPGRLLGLMDLGFAQWRLGRLGLLTRIDLRLEPGVTLASLRGVLPLPAGVTLVGPDAGEARLANLSRAYRVNLNVLALVALFTGSFLVFSLQAQATLARRPQLAYLRAAGVTAGGLQRLLIAEAAAVGIVGSALGILLGIGIARAVLGALGGDLGGGYFGAFDPGLLLPAGTTAGYAALGVLAAIAGGALPAREAARATIAPALRAGAEEDALRPLGSVAPGLLLLAVAAGLVWLPAVGGVSLAAYGAIACLLIGVIALQPRLASLAFRPVSRCLSRSALGTRSPMLLLAANRLAGAPGGAAIGMAGIVASFGLMVAMGTMVGSFRGSLEAWLVRVLPADVYARIGQFATDTYFSPEDLRLIAGHPGVARVELSRLTSVVLAPDRAPVAIISRPVDTALAAEQLPLVGAEAELPQSSRPAWVSEAMADLYGARPGEVLELPLAGRLEPFTVAGVWRDYARQFGSVILRTADYERVTGDTRRTEAALWLKPGIKASDVIRDLQQAVPSGEAVQFSATGDIRALSLRVFDRSFAVTYVLEIAAILIGMIGVAATFSAQAIARTREFGMLRHLGVTRGQVLRVLALEGALATGHALLVGLATGLLVSVVLIRVVNRQSFHWTMDFAAPAGLIAGLCFALLACATITAALAGRRATGVAPLRAVHEDW